MTQYDYYAFISYNSKDAQRAELLQKRIESYKLPTSLIEEYPDIPRDLRPVFRDKSDLGAGILPKELELALNSSRFLIVICSRNAAKSEWVNNEVKHFIEAGRTEQIIPFIVDGVPYAGDDKECFPKAIRELRGKDNELLGININELGEDAASVKVVARLLGLKFDALWGRHLKEEEKEKQRLIEQKNRLRTSKERVSVNKAFALIESGQNLLAAKVALDIIDSDKKGNWEPLPEVEHLLRVSTMGSQDELFPLLSFDDNWLFSPDGKYLHLSNGYRCDLIQLDPYSVAASLSLSEKCGGPVFDEDSNFLAIADSRFVYIIGLGNTSQEISIPVEPKSTIITMKFITRNDNSFLCVVYSNGIIMEYNLLNSEQHHTSIEELKQFKITNAFICDRHAILYVKSQESDDVIIYKADIHDGTVEYISRTEEEFYLYSDDCTKLVFSTIESWFGVLDLTTNGIEYCQHHGGHPSYVSNSGMIRFDNSDGTVDILGCNRRYIALGPFCRFWLSADEKTCAFAIKDKEKNTIVFFNPDLGDCENYCGYIDISWNAIEIKRYKGKYLETLKVFGQHFVATGGDFGIDIYDAKENRLVRHSEEGNYVDVASDCNHLIVTNTLNLDPSRLYRYSPFCHPVSTARDYDILTLDASGSPFYYNLANKGQIEFFTDAGNSHVITLEPARGDHSLIDVHKGRQLAVFLVDDRPRFRHELNRVFDHYLAFVSLKDFRLIYKASFSVLIIKARLNKASSSYGIKADGEGLHFSHDGKWLLSIDSTNEGLFVFAYDIDNEEFDGIPVSYRPMYYDRNDRYWVIANINRITVYSTDGSLKSEKIVSCWVYSLRFIGEDKVFAYPFLFDVKRDVVTHLENAPEIFRVFKFDIDIKRNVIVAYISDMDFKLFTSVLVWQISSCKLVFSSKNMNTRGIIGFDSPFFGDKCIYWKEVKLPYPRFEDLVEEMSERFAGYKLSDDFREKYYLED